jgi:hypothetical protein
MNDDGYKLNAAIETINSQQVDIDRLRKIRDKQQTETKVLKELLQEWVDYDDPEVKERLPMRLILSRSKKALKPE